MPENPREVQETTEISEIPADPVNAQTPHLTREHLQRIADLMMAPISDPAGKDASAGSSAPAQPENEV